MEFEYVNEFYMTKYEKQDILSVLDNKPYNNSNQLNL